MDVSSAPSSLQVLQKLERFTTDGDVEAFSALLKAEATGREFTGKGFLQRLTGIVHTMAPPERLLGFVDATHEFFSSDHFLLSVAEVVFIVDCYLRHRICRTEKVIGQPSFRASEFWRTFSLILLPGSNDLTGFFLDETTFITLANMPRLAELWQLYVEATAGMRYSSPGSYCHFLREPDRKNTRFWSVLLTALDGSDAHVIAFVKTVCLLFMLRLCCLFVY